MTGMAPGATGVAMSSAAHTVADVAIVVIASPGTRARSTFLRTDGPVAIHGMC